MPEHEDAAAAAEMKRLGGGDRKETPMDVDDWGLPIRKAEVKAYSEKGGTTQASSPVTDRATDESTSIQVKAEESKLQKEPAGVAKDTKSGVKEDSSNSDDDDFQDASSIPLPETTAAPKKVEKPEPPVLIAKSEPESEPEPVKTNPESPAPAKAEEKAPEPIEKEDSKPESPAPAMAEEKAIEPIRKEDSKPESPATAAPDEAEQKAPESAAKQDHIPGDSSVDKTLEKGLEKGHKPEKSKARVSEWSHQQSATQPEEEIKEEEEDEWQTMPAYAPFDMYDDDNKLVAREAKESDEEDAAYAGLGGAGKGYTRVQLDEDAQSATSMDEHTSYLFKEAHGTSAAGQEDEDVRDAVSQMQATKDLLTEGQRIAYVGMTRLVLSAMVTSVGKVDNAGKSARKEVGVATEAMRMWSQKMMIRLYAHMEISTPEQIMIEQLAEHGVEPRDLTPTLMQNARVKNPMAETTESAASGSRPGSLAGERSPRDSVANPRLGSLAGEMSPRYSTSSSRLPEEEAAAPPPPYVEVEGEDLPEVRTPGQLPTTKDLDIDLRWTVLCDLFLTLVADSVYDARSRVLLEQVGSHLDVTWLDICRFEKRVTDALEMQQASEKENWNEDEHKENRRKMALKKRYMMMGLATVGGGLVIGLSAGLLAPVIGAGLAAGFTTIGVAGTSGFLAGAGGAAIITSAAATSGGVIAVRAANRRTGAVKTFEYRPLHNNKRVNLIVTVSGWMTGKVDDVRLPYSTVDPIMGDIYSVLWEPEMLTSMGDTINILATEALTQGLQQVLGNTILIGLMAAAQLPLVLTKLSYLIDNPWTVSLGRAEAAGLILADSLIDRNLGTRPVTFVGYSLGSRVIFSCLRELSRRGAHGLVQNVYLFGSPVVAKRDDYLKARAVVAGRFVNGYARNDWILGYLFRLTSGGISRIAGLAPVNDIPGLENVDVTDLVPGHMAYRTAMPRLLREVGWLVESDEFTEIEDPDPENHQKRQRELINEIEEARKEFDRQEREAKGAFGFLRRKKKSATTKKEWETYEESRGAPDGDEGLASKHDSVLFDIDAIRAELASENLEVRELPSTLPPMRLDLSSSGNPAPAPPSSGLRDTKSADAVPTLAGYEASSATGARKGYDAYGPGEGYKSYHASPYEEADEPMQMSFDTAYVAPPAHSPAAGFGLATDGPLGNAQGGGLRADEVWGDERRRMDEVSPRVSRDERDERDKPLPPPPPPGGEARPGLKPSWTAPVPDGRNAWAEHSDDEDEFKEKEMEMTFA